MAGVSKDELKQRLNIVAVVSEYVALRKTGRSHKGLCPFHDDKNPSLHVDEEKGMFHCFSCKAGGDVFTFVQKIKGCSFAEALNGLAEKAGVKIQNRLGRPSENDVLLEINKAVCGFFQKSLEGSSPEAGAARDYLKRRALTAEIISRFSIGYAPVSGVALPKFLSSRGFSQKRCAELGLISFGEKSADGRGFDNAFGKFRGRVMFPIFSSGGEVTGFGGRALADARGPKYLNSPESAVYKKRRSLYGLNAARGEISKLGAAVLVEGYTDLLAVYAAGVKNAAASLGTSLTGEQAGILRRYADDIVILYDGDQAGMDCSLTAAEAFLASGVVARVARIPDGLDPDQFVKQKGAGALREIVEKAKPLTEILMDDIGRRIAEKKISQSVAAKRLMGIVPIMGRSPEVGPYVREVSRRFGFREADLYSVVPPAGSARRVPVPQEKTEAPEATAAEMMLLRIALKFPEISGLFSEKQVMKHLPDGEVKKIISSICASGIAQISEQSAAASGLLSQAHFTLDRVDFIGAGNVRGEVEKCLMKLKLDAISSELKSLRESLKLIENTADGSGEQELMERYRDLLRMRETAAKEAAAL